MKEGQIFLRRPVLIVRIVICIRMPLCKVNPCLSIFTFIIIAGQQCGLNMYVFSLICLRWKHMFIGL